MPDKPIVQECREWRDKNLPRWRPYYDGMREYRAFLDGDRYVNNSDWYNRDRRLVQIVGRETDDAVRHYVARAMEKPLMVEARPIDQESDPDQAEVEVALINQELEDPRKCFNEYLEMTVRDARELGMGIMWMDWCPEESPWGEIVFCADDPLRYMWDWQYADSPHHLLCNKLQRVHRMDVDYARERYKAPWLKPDREGGMARSHNADQPLLNLRSEKDGQQGEDDLVTVIEEWRKNDRTLKGKKETDQRKLKPEDRYMACETCGYRSDTQGVLQSQEKITEPLPEFEVCPECEMKGMSGIAERVDVLGMEQPTLLYAKGRRLIIFAPHQQGPDDKPLWDGAWPVPKARTYPMLYLCMDPKRGRPMGESDPSWNWSLQIAADHWRTQSIQRVFEHRSYTIFPDEGITTADGKRAEFRDDDIDRVLFRDSTGGRDLRVDNFNASGIDPQAMVAFQPIYQSLTQFRGQYDQGPVDERTAKSGVALQTENAIGEIPVTRFKKILHRALSQFYGVLSDYQHSTYTPARLTRLNMEGIDVVTRMWGQDMPNFDFIIEETPDFLGLEQARSQAWDSAQQIIQLPMPPETKAAMLESWAKFHKVPRSVVRDLLKLLAQMPAPPQVGQDGQPLPPENGGPPMDEQAMLEEEMMAANGNGMVPSPEAA